MEKLKTRKPKAGKPNSRKRRVALRKKPPSKKVASPKATLEDVLRALGPKPSATRLLDAVGYTATIGRHDLSSALCKIMSDEAHADNQRLIKRMQKKKRRS